jgi:tRNA-Thr(GGU) m(6)t(6)A37 methyltransferase TsaA
MLVRENHTILPGDDMQPVTYTPIGVIHTPFRDPAGMPIQPCFAEGIIGTAELYPKYAAGLKDLEGFSRIILLYHFHRCKGWSPELVPFLDTHTRGVFSTRAPQRPNPIGLSIVGLTCIDGPVLTIAGADMLDETPLFDIKPYIPEFDPAFRRSSLMHNNFHTFLQESRLFFLHSRLN